MATVFLFPPATLAKLPQTGEAVQIFTYFSVKEDGMSLYGFAAREEQEMFEKLLLVNGVGPKGALGFLSVLNPSEIVMAILSDDVKTLSKAPGVGRKTAQRVILDLKDKFKTEDAVSSLEGAAGIAESVGGGDAKFEAIDAMTALGYSRSEAAQAVNAVAGRGHDNRGYFEGGAQAHDYLLRIEDRCFSWKTDEF